MIEVPAVNVIEDVAVQETTVFASNSGLLGVDSGHNAETQRFLKEKIMAENNAAGGQKAVKVSSWASETASFRVERFAYADTEGPPLRPLDRITPPPNFVHASSTDDSSIPDPNVGVPHLELARSIICMSSLYLLSSSIVALVI